MKIFSFVPHLSRVSCLAIVAALFAVELSAIADAQPSHLRWVGTWAASPMSNPANPGQAGPANSTYRNIVRISAGGSALRVELTNEFGGEPLTVGAAHIAASAGSGATQPGSDHALSFSGQPSVTIPVGAYVVSDPISMTAAPLSDLAVSVYLPQQRLGNMTCHDDTHTTNFTAAGDATEAVTMPGAQPVTAWCFVKGIEVSADSSDTAAIVTLGDSITDGAKSSVDANRRWPDVLAARLQADKKTAYLSVLNEGISGNRLLRDRAGQNALARFDRDVLAQSGVKYLIVLEGINDIGVGAQPRDPAEAVTTKDLIFAFSQLAIRAHQHGIKIFGATLVPYVGAGYASDAGEKIRQDVNEWIRTSGVFDGVIDFDQATRDPSKPTVMLPQVDSGDHLHPGDEGYRIMGSAIDLSIFR